MKRSGKPLKPVGRRGKRLRPLDDAARQACFLKFGSVCIFCRLAIKTDQHCTLYEAMHPEWAHIYTRGPGAHLRHHRLGALPLGASHHKWQTDNPKEGEAAMLACLTAAERDELEAARRARR